jgi:hypothetical protein
VIIGNNIASLKKIKASEEALRALLTNNNTKIFKNLPPKFFLKDDSYLSHFEISLKTKFEKVWNVLSASLVKFLANLAGAHKWNSQTQA